MAEDTAKLERREDCPPGYHFAYVNGRKYSVVDLGTMMRRSLSFGMLEASGAFMGWEAIEVVDGRLDSGTIIRQDTWEKLKPILEAFK